jgi:hypothetical protein
VRDAANGVLNGRFVRVARNPAGVSQKDFRPTPQNGDRSPARRHGAPTVMRSLPAGATIPRTP